MVRLGVFSVHARLSLRDGGGVCAETNLKFYEFPGKKTHPNTAKTERMQGSLYKTYTKCRMGDFLIKSAT